MNRRDIFAQNLKKRVMNTLMLKKKINANFLAISLSLVFLLWSIEGSAQGKKRAEATRTTDEMHIDGRLDEQAWQTAVPPAARPW